MFLYSCRLIFTPRARLVERCYWELYIRTTLSNHSDSRSYHDRYLYFHGGDISGIVTPAMFLMPDVRL